MLHSIPFTTKTRSPETGMKTKRICPTGLAKAVLASAVLAVVVTHCSRRESAELAIEIFNPGANSLFPVTSTLITGPTEAVLIDAQFQRNDALAIVDMISRTGKTLTTVYVSHGDPDYYFGLDVVRDAFPEAEIVATPPTVEKINATIDAKIEYWGPILGENAPRERIVPAVLEGSALTVDGEELPIVGLDGHDPAHTFVWIPSLETVVGGVLVYEGLHVWMADSKTPESRADWARSLDAMLALNPARIIPGHYLGTSSESAAAVEFTRRYVADFEAAAGTADTSAELVAALLELYPNFDNVGDLELGAQVVKGEVPWP